MKAELTQELKERFFAQYWGQKVLELPYLVMREVDGFYLQVVAKHNKPIHLRTLLSITDEEAIEVAKIMDVERSDFWTDQLKDCRVYAGDPVLKELDYDASFAKAGRQYVIDGRLSLYAYDYLRSVGIAIPFAGHSVADLVSAGWIKLTNPPA